MDRLQTEIFFYVCPPETLQTLTSLHLDLRLADDENYLWLARRRLSSLIIFSRA